MWNVISTACLGYSCRLSPVVSKASSGALEVMEGLARLREERDIVEILQVSHYIWLDAHYLRQYNPR